MDRWIYSFIIIQLVKGKQYTLKIVDPPTNDCKVATPTPLSDGVHVHLNKSQIQTDINITDGFTMWIGYAEVLENFVYKGCTTPTNENHYTLETKDLGRCYSICNSHSATIAAFGMRGKTCYCNVNYEELSKCGDFDVCDRPKETLCGGSEQKIAVYEKGNEDPGGNEENETLSCRTIETSTQKYIWQDCTHEHSYLCKTEKNGVTLYKPKKEAETWIESTEKCLHQKNQYPVDDKINLNMLRDSFPPAGLLWTGGVRGKIITTINSDARSKPGYREGYLKYTDNRFMLLFQNEESQDTIIHTLCDVTDSDKGTTIRTLTTTDNQGNDSDDTSVAFYIIIPVLLIIIGAISIAIIVIARKRNASKKLTLKDDDNNIVLNEVDNAAYETEDNVEVHDYHTLQPESEYVTINDSDLDVNKRDLYDHTGDKQELPKNNVYNKLERSTAGAYDQLNKQPTFNTSAHSKCNTAPIRTYNTLDEATTSNTGVYNTLNDAMVSTTGVYNKLDEATAFKVCNPPNETTISDTGVYNTLNETTVPNSGMHTVKKTKASNEDTYNTLSNTKAPDIGDYSERGGTITSELNKQSTAKSEAYEKLDKENTTNNTFDKEYDGSAGTAFRLNEENTPKTGEYFILEKQ